ncbi:unnamed protein product [Chrysoparadoxa australica]
MLKGRPKVVVVTGLRPDKVVEVAITINEEVRHACFTTPSDKSQWKIAMVSCNNHKLMARTGLWERLAKVCHEVDAIIHMGDQVYADEDFRRVQTGDTMDDTEKGMESAWVQAKKLLSTRDENGLLQEVPVEEWSRHRTKMVDYYRRCYRSTWNHPAVAAVLASCSNYMILDDHEIVDNLGDLAEHRDHASKDFFVAQAGYQAYKEYQEQLYHDVDFEDPTTPAFYSFSVCPSIGCFMTDNRIERSLRLPVLQDQYKPEAWKDKEFLGPAQWERLSGGLADDGEFSSNQVLLLVTPTPAIFLGSHATHSAAKIVGDAVGTWGNLPFEIEQKDLVTQLSGWQGKKRNRAAIILGGDIHVGGFSQARLIKQKGCILNEVTSSAIGNYPTRDIGGMKAVLVEGILKADAKLDFSFDVEHHDWIFGPNMGFLDIMLGEEGAPPHITGTLIDESGTAHIRNFKLGQASAPGIDAKDVDVSVEKDIQEAWPRESPKHQDRTANPAAEAAFRTGEMIGQTHDHKKNCAGCTCTVS